MIPGKRIYLFVIRDKVEPLKQFVMYASNDKEKLIRAAQRLNELDLNQLTEFACIETTS